MLKGGAGADAISGLGQAFFCEGARSLLVTARPAETKGAESLTTRLFERRQKAPHMPKCEVLRRTMIEMMQFSPSAVTHTPCSDKRQC